MESSRIVFSTLLGLLLFAGLLTVRLAAGGLLIVMSLGGVTGAVRRPGAALTRTIEGGGDDER
jgi:hypothetical protein